MKSKRVNGEKGAPSEGWKIFFIIINFLGDFNLLFRLTYVIIYSAV